ncbi:hypothetical protein CEXT_321631 [Caerostris extrusa]|uniref:EGF-like domain-containing protein n=1 Tax=Caerostris extrusa TaxID=172846 RepID=A0AAV4MDV2_CAEEX|nr:hypothetical protein CEXT_321631 [Caerostris extrusa]
MCLHLFPRIFENIAVNTGMIGCIRRLKIGKKEVDLRYPTSKDIIRGSGIHECGTSSCINMPCKNNAICEPVGENDYTCSCLPGFAGILKTYYLSILPQEETGLFSKFCFPGVFSKRIIALFYSLIPKRKRQRCCKSKIKSTKVTLQRKPK